MLERDWKGEEKRREKEVERRERLTSAWHT